MSMSSGNFRNRKVVLLAGIAAMALLAAVIAATQIQCDCAATAARSYQQH